MARSFKDNGARRQKGAKEKEDGLFASTPPLESLRMLLSKAVCSGRTGGGRKVLFLDAKKAHLNPLCMEEVYIRLPEEAGVEEGTCGKLMHWIDGMRQAAQAWEALYAAKLEEVGFVRGRGSPVVFYNEARDLSALAQGGDFVLLERRRTVIGCKRW